MPNQNPDSRRRELLKSATSLVAGAIALEVASGAASAAPSTPVPGKPGEFNFLAGSWKIQNRRLKKAGSKDWDTFPGEATCWTILGGVGSIEELRIPARDFAGMGLRLLDVEKRIWSDFWVNARSGVLTTPGLTGGFENGVGTFTAEENENGRVVMVRGVWDRITANSCRWHQAVSHDGGKTWDGNWFMDWTRT